jgi:DNA replication protein DnaC
MGNTVMQTKNKEKASEKTKHKKVSIQQKITEIGKTIIPHFMIKGEDVNLYNALAWYFLGRSKFENLDPTFSLKKGLFLQGNTGLGKSLSMKIMQSFAGETNKNKSFRFFLTTDVVSDYSMYGEQSLLKHGKHSFRRNRINGALQKDCPIAICYDDLGSEQKVASYYGNEKQVMNEIILKRYDLFISHGLITHFTSNYDGDAIAEYYGERILSRIREMCNEIVVEGQDRRI